MPRLRDIPILIRRYGLFRFAGRVYRESMADNVFTLASALAYSWLFALFPFLIFLLSFVPLVMPDSSRAQAMDALYASIDRSGLPASAAAPIRKMVGEILGGDERKKVGLLSIGLLVTIWVSSGGMATTMYAIDAAYDVKTPRPWLRQRLLAIVLTIVVAMMTIGVLILLPIGTLVVAYLDDHAGQYAHQWGIPDKWLMPIAWTWELARYTLAFFLMFGILALVYHFGPNIRRRFRFITPGSVFCVAIWLVLAFTFSTYIEKYGRYEKTYGTVGGVAILLLFFYIDALVLLIGAEINGEMDAVMKEQKGRS
jgi:membrane protein